MSIERSQNCKVSKARFQARFPGVSTFNSKTKSSQYFRITISHQQTQFYASYLTFLLFSIGLSFRRSWFCLLDVGGRYLFLLGFSWIRSSAPPIMHSLGSLKIFRAQFNDSISHFLIHKYRRPHFFIPDEQQKSLSCTCCDVGSFLYVRRGLDWSESWTTGSTPKVRNGLPFYH